jgi:hypothetical protein
MSECVTPTEACDLLRHFPLNSMLCVFFSTLEGADGYLNVREERLTLSSDRADGPQQPGPRLVEKLEAR